MSPREELLSELNNLWMEDSTNESIKKELQITDYRCLRSCIGFLLDYRTTVEVRDRLYIADVDGISITINKDSLEILEARRMVAQ